MSLYAVVLAGGHGTRLWPHSRRSRPKQLVPFLDGRSMLQTTVARLEPLVGPDRVYVLTGADHVEAVRAQLPDVPPEQVVGEPSALGTAPALALGTALVAARDEGATLVLLPADHVIAPESAFHEAVERAVSVAAEGRLVTFGVRPTSAQTGYGYIELGEALPGPHGAYEVARFVEKPDRPTAEAYLAGGRHLWNSGILAWNVETISSELARHLPNLAARADELRALAARPPAATLRDEALAEIWGRIEDRTTIDYGVLEKSDRVACIPVDFLWSDVGSWSALADALEADASGNTVVGRHAGLDTTRSLIFAAGDRLVATIGVDDLVIVDTGEVVLVCHRSRAEDVRRLVAELARRGDEDLL